MVKPILLYGCEIWGFGNLDIVERVQLKFLKHILCLKKNTSNIIVYGETGTKPLSIEIKARMISFWAKLIVTNYKKLTTEIYAVALSNFKNSHSNFNFKWITCIKDIFIECGMANIWMSHEFPNVNWLVKSVKQKLSDIFINQWYSGLENTSNCKNYCIFKRKFEIEKYLSETPSKYLKYMIKFRTRNHKLPVETGNWHRIPLEQRKCTLCNHNIGDEFHFLLECPNLNTDRKKYISEIYYRNPNIIKFDKLMNTDPSNYVIYKKLCKFIKIILEKH